MTKTLRIIFITISVLLLNIPSVAQEAVDSLSTDSITADTIEVDTKLPWEQQLSHSIDKMLEEKMLQTSEVGIMVWDLTADSCLYRYQERQRMRPASTMKAVTAITALDALGESYKLKTELRYTGHIQEFTDMQEPSDSLETPDSLKTQAHQAPPKKTLRGSLYIVGGMDPLFDDNDLKAFVNSVKALGVDSIIGGIYADRSFKDNKRYGNGWCWDDENPNLSALLLNKKDHLDDELRSRLRMAGIILLTSNTSATAPDNSILLCRREHKLTDVMRPMMKHSDNLIAECVFYQIAHQQGGKDASASDARQRFNRLIRNIGLDDDDYTIADGSGLSLYNYVSAELETLLLRYAYQHRNIYNALLPTLPQAGIDGTLSSRMKGSKAHGNVQAKTGTVAGISSLTGYCTAANGHRLCFSIINQGIKGHKQARAFQDRLCNLLCR